MKINRYKIVRKKAIFKMAKSIVARKNIEPNTRLSKDHLSFKSPGGGLKPYEIKKVLGKLTNKKLFKDDCIKLKDLTKKSELSKRLFKNN